MKYAFINKIEKKIGRKFTIALLKSRLKYFPLTGKFLWISGNREGEEAGCARRYTIVNIFGQSVPVHVLAFFYMKGRWPKEKIDHQNKNKNDNRWKNLREANNSQNLCNRGKQKNNTSGFKGVYKNRKGWISLIKANGELRYLGKFDNPEKAHAAYRKAAKVLHGAFASW